MTPYQESHQQAHRLFFPYHTTQEAVLSAYPNCILFVEEQDGIYTRKHSPMKGLVERLRNSGATASTISMFH